MRSNIHQVISIAVLRDYVSIILCSQPENSCGFVIMLCLCLLSLSHKKLSVSQLHNLQTLQPYVFVIMLCLFVCDAVEVKVRLVKCAVCLVSLCKSQKLFRQWIHVLFLKKKLVKKCRESHRKASSFPMT